MLIAEHVNTGYEFPASGILVSVQWSHSYEQSQVCLTKRDAGLGRSTGKKGVI